MGKKKRTSQSSNSAVNCGDSSGSESSKETSQGAEESRVNCNHIAKSVESRSILRKNIKSNKDAYLICPPCRKSDHKGACQDGWLCLRCASYNCGPGDADHRTQHFKTPHSDAHSLAFQLSTNKIWCFHCQQEIPIDATKNVQSCIDLVKKQFAENALKPVLQNNTDAEKATGDNSSSYFKFDNTDSQPLGRNIPEKEITAELNLPKVRGLINLGNTCFFNSVLQCLAQTPGLVAILEEMDVPGKEFHLELDGTVIDAVLEKHKSSEVSEQLARILKEVAGTSSASDNELKNLYNAVNPRSLLKALTNKCPQFEGGDQHDSHELLRHLLDSVYKEDLKRYQVPILAHIGYYKSKNLEVLDEEEKRFGKKLNQKVCDTITITPEQLFQGSLVSILQCTECKHISKRQETFLDLSLPVALEKPQPPRMGRKQTNSIEQFCNSSIEEKDSTEETSMSKHQLKKLRRKKVELRGTMKSAKYSNNKVDTQGEPTIEEENKKDSMEGEVSDADVEDNEDTICEPKTEVVESGYSSEKQASPRGSPLTTQMTDDLGCEVEKSTIDAMLPADRAESGVGSIQELTVAIPEECLPDCSSKESVHVNASNGSPDISSDSQQGNVDLSTEYQLPLGCSNSSSFRRELVLDWNCDMSVNEPLPHSHDSSLSISPHCTSRDKIYTCGSQSTSLPNSNDNMSICDSLPENVSLMNKIETSPRSDADLIIREKPNKINFTDESLESHSSDLPKEDTRRDEIINLHSEEQSSSGSPGKVEDSAEEASGSVELNNSKIDYDNNSFTQMRRCSPVEVEEVTELDSGLLKLSLEGVACEGDSERRSSPVTNDSVFNDQAHNGIELAGGVNMIPLPPPSPTVVLYTYTEPSVSLYDGMYSKHKIEEGECSLQSCLNQFTTIEMLAGGNKVGCEACTERINKGNKDGKTVYQNSSKQLLICKLPHIMIFHLKRFQVQRCSFRKISRHVVYPLVLDISPFCSLDEFDRRNGPILYSLYGVVEHSGTLHGGHYVAYVKVRSFANKSPGVPPSGKWYYISDSIVCAVKEQEVLNKQAYLLFYERIL